MSKNSLYLMNFNNHAILSHQYYLYLSDSFALHLRWFSNYSSSLPKLLYTFASSRRHVQPTNNQYTINTVKYEKEFDDFGSCSSCSPCFLHRQENCPKCCGIKDKVKTQKTWKKNILDRKCRCCPSHHAPSSPHRSWKKEEAMMISHRWI